MDTPHGLWGIFLLNGTIMKYTVHRVLIFNLFFLLIGFAAGKEPANQWRRGSVSHQNLLSNARFHWEDDRLFFDHADEEDLVSDTLKILAIRVEFQTDEDPRTTGKGRFDLSFPSEPMIDPPPHDRSYFVNQLSALSNYYNSVSNGNLVLLSEVVDTIFTLSSTMSAYNPGTTEEAVDLGLAELFRDAIQLADAKGILFSEYDCYIVFHAGVGRDVNLGLDPTPSDIPSAFLSLSHLREHLAQDNPLYKGISVEHGSHFIEEGIILPETESQEGFEIALLGTMAVQFGFQIGLPALWDTETSQSGIGMWGLMDQGSGNYYGLIPAEPCAWSKVFLGWETPVDTVIGDSLKVACSKAKHSNKIYRIPINDHEYFLIENRVHDPNGDGVTRGFDSAGNEYLFQSNYEIVPPPSDVIVRVEEYDFGLPGSGILIWHVDEDVIRERLSENRVNVDKDHRGVDLEEADGAQDIGESYGMTDIGAGAESGLFEDAWFEDNAMHMSANQSNEVVFSSNAHPDSRSYSGAHSHLVISDFSKTDTVMTFSISNDWIHEGFPQAFGLGDGISYPPLFGDIDGDEETEIIVATEGGALYAWEKDGEDVVSNDELGYRISVSGDTIYFPVALFAHTHSRIVAEPVFSDRTDQANACIITATEEGAVQAWEITNGNVQQTQLYFNEGGKITSLMKLSDQIVFGTESGSVIGVGYPEEFIWRQDLQSGGITGLCQYEVKAELHALSQYEGNDDTFLGVLTEDGNFFLFDSRGNIIWNCPISDSQGWTAPASAMLQADQLFSLVALMDQGIGFIIRDENDISRFGDHVLPVNPSDPALGDVDGDGFMEIVVTAGGQVWSFDHNRSLSDYLPAPFFKRDVSLSPPVLGDIDGDGHIDIITTTSNGDVEAYHYNGTLMDGFPLSTGGSTAIPPALLDLDSDGDIEMAAVSEKGFLFVWDLPGRYHSDSVPWGSHLHDVAHTGMNSQSLQSVPTSGHWMPTQLVYNYPNPTEGNFTTIRYRLEQPALVDIQIFDLTGELVDALMGPGEGQADNEAIWDLTHVESGVYFCQVRARGAQGEKVVTFKIAVIK